MSIEIHWNDIDKKLLRLAHDVSAGSPAWLLPPAPPANEFPLNGLPGGEATAPARARLLVLAGTLSVAIELELRTPYPENGPPGGLALPSPALKDMSKHAGRAWPAAPDNLLDGPEPGAREHSILEIAGTDISDAADVLSHAATDPILPEAQHGVQVRRGVGAGATDGHRSTIPTALARGAASFDDSLFLPADLVYLLRAAEARDATVERWQDCAGNLRCLASGHLWRAAWVTPRGAEPAKNPSAWTPRLIAGPAFAAAVIAPEAQQDRGERAALRRAIADCVKWSKKFAAGTVAIELRLGPGRVEVWGPTKSPEYVQENGKDVLRTYAPARLGAFGHPDPLPPWTLLDGPAWIRVQPQYVLDALELATPLREVRLLGTNQADACTSPVVFYGDRQTSVVMPIVPSEIDALRAALKERAA
jgi:hypothetical protein